MRISGDNYHLFEKISRIIDFVNWVSFTLAITNVALEHMDAATQQNHMMFKVTKWRNASNFMLLNLLWDAVLERGKETYNANTPNIHCEFLFLVLPSYF